MPQVRLKKEKKTKKKKNERRYYLRFSKVVEFPGDLVVKDRVLSLLWRGLNPWRGNFHMCGKKKKKKKKKKRFSKVVKQ